MAMKKITHVGDANSADGPWNLDNPNTPWFVAGVAYTDNAPVLAYMARTPGYTVTDPDVGQPDAAHLAAVAKLKDQAGRTFHHTASCGDAVDGGRIRYFR
ncbi:hypothetical protein OG967_39895 [Streptomyces phaeochromogenes]